MNGFSGLLSFPSGNESTKNMRFDNSRFAERAQSASEMHDERLAKIDRDRGAVDGLNPTSEMRELAGGLQGKVQTFGRGLGPRYRKPARRA